VAVEDLTSRPAARRTRQVDDRLRTAHWVVFAVVVVAALFVAYWNLGRQRVDVDEDVYVRAGWQYLHGVFSLNAEQPPVAKYLYGLGQLLVGREGALGARIVAATASLVTGLLLFVWFRRPVGFPGAIIAAGLWWLTPRANGAAWADPGSGVATRIDRTGLLEPIMMVFAIAALFAAWKWITTSSRWRWCWAAGAGVLLAASVTSKVSTAVLVVAIVALPLLFRRWWEFLTGGLIAAAAFVATFLALYLPVGLHRFFYMLQFQSGQVSNGHTISLLGQTYQFAPWWANFVYLLQGTSRWLVPVLVIGVLAAFVFRPDRLVLYLTIALASIVVFYVRSDVALAHYYYAWMPLVIALVGIGLGRAGWPPTRTAWSWVRTVAVAVVLLLSVVPAVRLGAAVVQARPAGIARLEAALRARGVDRGTILFTKYNLVQWQPFVGKRGTWASDADDITAVVQGVDPRFPVKPGIRQYLETHADDLTHFTVDDLNVWVPKTGALVERDDVLGAATDTGGPQQ